ncbi:MAG: CHASE2 domain-containing protein, partial [candidate division Zixibacteria bacterium]|nr:CHASE2 domain-containing protein [candidate division Zixibacteria bacterium]
MNKYTAYILYLLIAIFVVILSINNFGPMQAMQRSLTDLLCQITSSDEARPNVLLVRVDGKSQNEYGAWPWDHDLIADLTAAVASGEPKAILLDFELPEDAAQDSAGHTDVLARQLIWIDQAVLSYDIALATFRSNKTSNPEYLFPNFIQTNSLIGTMDEQSSLVARKVFLPAEKILAHKPYLGFNYSRPDGDRILRHQPMAMYYEGYYYPSLSLATAAVALGVPFDQIKVFEGEEIQIGSERTVPINSQGDFFINFGPGVPFKEYSASEILSSGFDFGKLKGQTVVIAVADIDANMLYATPTGPEVSVPVIDATVIENIVNSNFLTIWDDAPALQLLLLFILGGVCAFVLPRVNLMYRMIILGGGLILLINVTYLLFTSYQLVLEPMYLVLELVLFMIASPVLDSQFITGEKARPSAKASARPKPRSTKPEPLPELREIVASDTDPENVETQHVAEPASTSQPMAEASIDHQTITLDDDAPLPPVVPTPETPTRGLTDSDRTAINGLAAQDPVAQDAAITGNDVLFETPVPERPDTARDSQG